MSPLLSKKAVRYIAALKAALDAAKYDEIPELSRKVRKHSVESTGLARSAEVQALLMRRVLKAQKLIDEHNFNGAYTTFHWFGLSRADMSIEEAFLKEAQSIPPANSEDNEIIRSAQLFFLVVAQETDQALSLRLDSPLLNMTWRIQTAALEGIAHELSGDSAKAVESYIKGMSTNQPSQASVPWLDHILYRLAMLEGDQHYYDMYIRFTKSHGGSTARVLHVLSTRPGEDYRKYLFHNTAFPTAASMNTRLTDYVSSVMDPWFFSGQDPLQAERLLDMLFDAAGKTFHSPRILRYIFYALNSLGRYDEAVLALKAYLQIAIHALHANAIAEVDTPTRVAETVYFALAKTLYRAPQSTLSYVTAQRITKTIADAKLESSDAHLQAVLHAIRGKTAMLTYHADHKDSSINAALSHYNKAAESESSTSIWFEISLIYAYKNEIPSALSAIRQALETNSKDVAALACFANLLCCEELYDRAETILKQVLAMKILVSDPFATKEKYFTAALMHARVLEKIHGTDAALDHCSSLFSTYSRLFTSRSDSVYLNGAELNVRSSTPAPGPVSMPQIRVPDGTDTPRSSLQSPDDNSMIQSRKGSIPRSIQDRGNVDRTLRSTSLKLAHPHLRIAQHLNLRKSASARSLQNHKRASGTHSPQPGSSRSSSPMHPPATALSSVTSLSIPDIPSEPPTHDSQMTAPHQQAEMKNHILAELWLYVAELLCRASDSSLDDAQAAIEEARELVGQTDKIITAHASTLIALVPDLDALQRSDVQQNFEIALLLDDDNLKTAIEFSKFMLKDHTARAYELIERQKQGLGFHSAEVWSLSAQIADIRGEDDRAEREWWRVVELSDASGVLPWPELAKRFS